MLFIPSKTLCQLLQGQIRPSSEGRHTQPFWPPFPSSSWTPPLIPSTSSPVPAATTLHNRDRSRQEERKSSRGETQSPPALNADTTFNWFPLSVQFSLSVISDSLGPHGLQHPVHHQLPELAQTHVHPVNDAIQPPHPLSSPSPPVFNLSQHQGLFRVSSSHQVAKVLEFQLQHHSFQ